MNHSLKSPKTWFLALLFTFPLLLTLDGFSLEHGLLNLPRFGSFFYHKSIPQVQALNPPHYQKYGYDGQFYVQIAMDPTLRDPALVHAVDDIGYRGQRIGLSAVAHVLGLGKPAWIAQIYCALNYGFWCLLCWLVIRRVGIDSMEQRCVLVVTVCTAGALVSISRALTDLPAAALGLLALHLNPALYGGIANRSSAALAFAASTLCKETGVLSAISLWSLQSRRQMLVSGAWIGASLIPLFAWLVYVKLNIGSGKGGLQNFTFPLYGIGVKLQDAFTNAWTEFPSIHIVEIIGPASILIQTAYLFRRFDYRSEVWRFGIGFACLVLFLAFPVWETQTAFSRVLLPLTLAFNLHLSSHQKNLSRASYLTWFWCGNAGLIDRGLPMLLVWFLFEAIVSRFKLSSTSTAAS